MSTTPRQSVRLSDVAALAGVSTKTASNVLNGAGRYSTRTEEAVRAAVAKLDYRPNVSARNLRRGRTGLIALVVSELRIDYYAELATHLLAAASAHGMSVIVEQTMADVDRELELIDGMRGALVDGVILSPLRITEEHLRQIDKGPVIVLLGDEISAGVSDHVGFDNVAATRTAVEHLIELGRTRIGVIGTLPPPAGPGERRERMRVQREQGFTEALTAAGLPPDPAWIEPTRNLHFADGAQGMRRILDRGDPPDAIFCLNDLVALGAMRTLHDAGLRIPGDVAVIGFDGIDKSRYSYPRLSTIAPDTKALAYHAVRVLWDRIHDPRRPAQDVQVGFTLEARESTVGT